MKDNIVLEGLLFNSSYNYWFLIKIELLNLSNCLNYLLTILEDDCRYYFNYAKYNSDN